jgi:hypothetical protein
MGASKSSSDGSEVCSIITGHSETGSAHLDRRHGDFARPEPSGDHQPRSRHSVKAHIALTVAPGDAEGPAPVGYHGETPALPEPPLGQGRQHLVIRSITGEPRRARLHPAQLK